MYWKRVLKEVKNKKSSNQFFAFTNLTSLPAKNDSKLKKTKVRRKYKQYFLNPKRSTIYFTRREAECMVLMLNGKTIKETAKILDLSYRTVEFYLKNMKEKLHTKTRGELIGKVLRSEFLKSVDF